MIIGKRLLPYQDQTIESDGVFFTDPTLGDLEIQRYHDDHLEDEFDNASLTIEGSIGDLGNPLCRCLYR